MKTITKTFYVSDGGLKLLNSTHDSNITLRNKDESNSGEHVTNKAIHKIQISWQEPEKKIEITESELKTAMDEIGWSVHAFNELKIKLFGASDE